MSNRGKQGQVLKKSVTRGQVLIKRVEKRGQLLDKRERTGAGAEQESGE